MIQIGYIDIEGKVNAVIGRSVGSIRINYTETINSYANTSTITITSVQVMSTNRYQYTFRPAGTITIGGQTITLSNNNEVYIGNQNTYVSFPNIATISATFANDGSGSSQANINIGSTSGYNDFNVFCMGSSGPVASGNIEINTCVRSVRLSSYATETASTISINPSSVYLGDNIAINVNAAKSSYYHDLSYSLDGQSWISAWSTRQTGGSYTFNTNAMSSIFGESSETKTFTFMLKTYPSSTSTSQIGSASTATVSVTPAGSPVINLLNVSPISDNIIVQSWFVFVQGYSKAQISVSYSLPTGASLRAYDIRFGGRVISSGSSMPESVTTEIISSTGKINVSVNIVDSRGNSATKTETIDVYSYSNPYLKNANVMRYSTSIGVEDKSGPFVCAKADIGYSSVNGNNTVHLITTGIREVGTQNDIAKAYLTDGNMTSYKKINISESGETVALPLTSSYIITFYVTDLLHSGDNAIKIEMMLTSNNVTLHSKNGGNGLGIGMYNNLSDYLQIAYNSLFYSDAQFFGNIKLTKFKSYGIDPPSGTGMTGQLYFQLIE